MEKERKYVVPVDITIRVEFNVGADSQLDAIKRVERLDMEQIFSQWRVVNVACVFLTKSYAEA